MYAFIEIQYKLGNLSDEQVISLAPKWITIHEAEAIIHRGLHRN